MHPPVLTVVALAAFGIGIVAGLRSLTAPATTAWGAHLNWLSLAGTPFTFMGSTAAVAILTLLAIVELVADKLPSTPSRTAPVGLIARIRAIGRRCCGCGWQGICPGCRVRSCRRNRRRVRWISDPQAVGDRSQGSRFCHRPS